MEYRYIGDPDRRFNVNNPFLDLLGDIENNIQQEPFNFNPPVNEFEPRGNMQRMAFKLPEYWAHAPAMWFARAEFRFEVANIQGEREKFAHIVDALPYESLRLVNDLLMAPPAERPYTELKGRLLLATQLTPVQMADRLMKMPELGDRRPSQLLAQMMEYCPPGEEGTAFFRAAYLTRLPADIRGHLDGLETGSLKDLAARADRQWANVRGTADMMAHVDAVDGGEEEGETLAAVKQAGKKWIPRKKEAAGTSGGAAKGDKKGWEKTVQLTLCKRHVKFGDRAYSCADPSTCQYSRLGN